MPAVLAYCVPEWIFVAQAEDMRGWKQYPLENTSRGTFIEV